MHDERLISANSLHSLGTIAWTVIRWRVFLEVGNVFPDPLALVFVPPDELLAFAPRLPVGTRGGAVVENPAIGGPRKSPTVSKGVVWFARIGTVDAGLRMNSRIDPASASSAAILFQFRIFPN